jgi:hypothetical protein
MEAMMNVRLLQCQTTVSAPEWLLMKKQPDGPQAIIRRTAQRALAAAIAREGLITEVVEEPDPDSHDYVRGIGATFTFTAGVADTSDTATLAAQLAAAKAAGMREAANVMRDAAARYAGVEGGCSAVIAQSLRDAARKVELAAAE